MKLTAKQQAFIRWYCSARVNANGTKAARLAGYSGNAATLASMAKENLRKPHIRKEIDKQLSAAHSSSDITIEKILRDLESTYICAMETGKYSAAVRCLELQGKYLKMFSDRIEHIQTIEGATTDELIALLRELIGSGGIDIQQLVADSNVA